MRRKLLYNLLGLFSTIALSLFALWLTVGTAPLCNSATNLTSNGGDALKDFFNTYYHVKYDTSIVQNNSMNYPYGEHYTYTGVQLYVSAPLQILRRCFDLDYSQTVLLWINLIIWCSIILCSLFLYLIFRDLQIPIFYSVISAVFITYLSPQMDRISAHLSLSYSFIIPCTIFLFLRWLRTQKWTYTTGIALLTLFAGLTHPYYTIFIAAIWLPVIVYKLLFDNDSANNRTNVLIHGFIQFAFPVLLFMFLSKIGDTPSDRTAIPYGFEAYKGHISGLLSPVGRSFWPINNIEWESYSFVGFVALLVLVIGTISFVKKLLNKEYTKLLQVTNDNYLNILFWTAVALCIFSFGAPFSIFPKYFFNYYGPLSQLRAVGRFLWLMYYVLNIIAIYAIARHLPKMSKKVQIPVLIVAISLYAFDTYSFNKRRNCEHQRPLLTDYNNTLPENIWVAGFDNSKYQSILPLPMYSLGTEHIWLDPKADMLEKSFYVALKTGLPLHSIYASRSKIQEAYNNIAFSQSPYLPYEVLDKTDSTRAILIITPTNLNELNENEKRIITYSDSLFSSNGIMFFSIYPSRLQQLQKDFCEQKHNEYLQKRIYERAENIYCDDSTKAFYIENWDSSVTKYAFQGIGSKECKLNKWCTIYNGNNPLQSSDTLEISFMISDYTQDLVGRTTIEVYAIHNDKTVFYRNTDIFHFLENITNGWGHIKINVPPLDPDSKIKSSLRNKFLKPNQRIYIDNLMIKPTNSTIINECEPIITMNNSIINR